MFGRQAGGNYFTTYGYGTAGKAEAVQYIKNNFKAGTAMGANEFAWDLKAAGVPSPELSDACFIDIKCALAVMRDKNTSFFIFGQASNTVEQVKYFLALTPETLGRPFAVVKKGDFWIYNFSPNPRPPKADGLRTQRYARQVRKGVCRAERALAMRVERSDTIQ